MIPTAETRVFAITSKRNETEKKQCWTCSEDTHHQIFLTWEKDGKGPAVVTVPKNTQPFHRSAKGP